MQNFRNYYEILGITKQATAQEIKQAYRQLARQTHPDLNPGNKVAEERFKLLSEAYEVLSDPDKRSQYEDYSQFWKQGFWRSGSQVDADFSEWDDFNHFVDQLLNRHQEPVVTASQPRAVSQDDLFTPSKRKTTYTVKARSSRRDAEADLVVPLDRAYAGGRERIRLEDGRSLEVSMPVGMLTGQRIRLKGQGIGGGDLYLNITVQPHSDLRLQGNDIIYRLQLTPSEAVLGGQTTVPTLDGPVQMIIPEGVQPGQKLRLAGKGYPHEQSSDQRGDQIVEVAIAIPTHLSAEERALYQKIRSLEERGRGGEEERGEGERE